MNFTIYGSKVCPYCKKAINLINREGHQYSYIDIKQDSEAKSYITEELGMRTIPQIFHEGEHIGGYDELNTYLSG